MAEKELAGGHGVGCDLGLQSEAALLSLGLSKLTGRTMRIEIRAIGSRLLVGRRARAPDDSG